MCYAVFASKGEIMAVVLKILVACILAAIGWIDYKTMEIPDCLNVALGLCGLAAIWIFPEIPISERWFGAVCVSVPMFLFCRVVDGAFGDGDIFLLAVMGFYLGWKALAVGTFLGFLIGGMEALFLLVSGKVRMGEHAHMAFGPALCAGLFVAQFYGREIFYWYLSIFY